MSKLRIAITADTYSHATEVTNLVKAPFAPRGLVEVIAKLGAIPVVLPDVQGLKGEDYLDLCDGLIIPGGPDVDPTLFGEEPRWKVGVPTTSGMCLNWTCSGLFIRPASPSSVSAGAAS
jgi:putative glutamine amidotransferase